MEATHEEHIRDHLLELKEKLNETAALSKESSYLSGLRQEVEHTLQKIEKGTFGVCEECNCAIEEDYLEANPMARICFSHLSEEQKESITPTQISSSLNIHYNTIKKYLNILMKFNLLKETDEEHKKEYFLNEDTFKVIQNVIENLK